MINILSKEVTSYFAVHGIPPLPHVTVSLVIAVDMEQHHVMLVVMVTNVFNVTMSVVQV